MAKPVIEQAHYTVLRKLAEIGKPMNMLEIGFSASAQVIRNMAARGMVRVEVTLTSRGQEVMDGEMRRRKRTGMKSKQAAREASALAPEGNVMPIFVPAATLKGFG